MEKYFTCKQEELDRSLDRISKELQRVSYDLLLFYQQFEGTRTNMTLEDAKSCYERIERVSKYLSEFGKTRTIPNFETAKKELEERMNEDVI